MSSTLVSSALVSSSAAAAVKAVTTVFYISHWTPAFNTNGI